VTKKPRARSAESMYRSIVEQSQGLICVHDLSGVLRYTNPASAAELGFSPAELIGRNGRALLAPRMQPLFDEYLERIRRQKIDNGILRLNRRNGEERLWAYRNVLHEEGPDAPYVIGHAVDITEYWHTKRKLQESEQRSTAVLAALEEGIVFCGADGSVKEFNAIAERILGTTPDRLFGLGATEPPWRVIHDDGSPCSRETRPDAVTLRTGQPCLRIVLGLGHADGKTVWLEVNSQPVLRHRDKTVHGVVVSFTDITERRRRETEREQELKEAIAGLKVLRGLLPICSSCKKIRADDGSWQPLETYISRHSEADFTHGLCPVCLARIDPTTDPTALQA
jgi:PAS domain S-box-containing protein